MWLTLEMRSAVRCLRCNVRAPLPGLRVRTTCPSCAANLDVAKMHEDARDGGVRYCFGGYYDVVAQALVHPDGAELDDARDGQNIPVTIQKKPLACRCGVALSVPEAGAARVTCASCGAIAPVRWPDDTTRAWDPRLHCVVGDEGDRATAPTPAQGTVVPCGNCAAPLAVDTRSRTVTCDHCGTPNFLSDAVWIRLYPDEDAHPFTLVYALGDKELFALFKDERRLDEDELERGRALCRTVILDGAGPLDLATAQDLAHRKLDDADTAKLDARLDDAVRAKLELVRPPLLAAWARATAASTREVAARVAAVDAPFLPELAADGEAAVRRAVASRKKLPPAIVEALAGDPDPAVRAALAARHTTPQAILDRLRKDPDAAVQAAVAANPSYRPSLWTRLFG